MHEKLCFQRSLKVHTHNYTFRKSKIDSSTFSMQPFLSQGTAYAGMPAMTAIFESKKFGSIKY